LSLLGILAAHEFGYTLMSRYYKTPATLPFFIPFPFSPLGTLGAAIIMKGTPRNTRVLFDIGVAGPLAGLIVAIPVLWLGLSLSTLGPVEDAIYQAPMPGEQAICPSPSFQADGSYTCSIDNSLEGNSLFYLGMKYLRFGKLLPAPADYEARRLHTGSAIFSPEAQSRLAARMCSSTRSPSRDGQDSWSLRLNLLPAGTLDGGHVVYSLFGEKAGKVFPFILLFLAMFGFFWTGWWLWAALLLWLGRVHAQPLDQITTLDPPRRMLALAMIVIFVLVFAPVPFVTF
jgi:membrane-associated protease RseP (regulator of RpoE activity)